MPLYQLPGFCMCFSRPQRAGRGLVHIAWSSFGCGGECGQTRLVCLLSHTTVFQQFLQTSENNLESLFFIAGGLDLRTCSSWLFSVPISLEMWPKPTSWDVWTFIKTTVLRRGSCCLGWRRFPCWRRRGADLGGLRVGAGASHLLFHCPYRSYRVTEGAARYQLARELILPAHDVCVHSWCQVYSRVLFQLWNRNGCPVPRDLYFEKLASKFA